MICQDTQIIQRVWILTRCDARCSCNIVADGGHFARIPPEFFLEEMGILFALVCHKSLRPLVT